MVIGSCRIIIYIPYAQSLKDKRQVVRRIKDRLRSRFNVAAAEVGDLDYHQRAEIGVVCVGNDQKYLNGLLNRALDMITSSCDCEIADVDMEFY